jgi:hypothetical protein
MTEMTEFYFFKSETTNCYRMKGGRKKRSDAGTTRGPNKKKRSDAGTTWARKKRSDAGTTKKKSLAAQARAFSETQLVIIETLARACNS